MEAHQHSKQQKDFKLKAEQLVRNGEWDKAASYFAKCGETFEDIALKLLSHGFNLHDVIQLDGPQQTGSTKPLRLYLSEVLLNLPLAAKSQRTMVCTWLCEIFLHEIAACQLQQKEEEKTITQDLMSFLRSNRSSFDVPTVLQLIVSRNNRSMLLFFVKIMGDYYRATCILISEKKYLEAIAVLADAPLEKVSSFLYKITPILVSIEPEKTFNMLASKVQSSIVPCLPTILHYSANIDGVDGDCSYAIKFLEEVFAKNGILLDFEEEVDDETIKNGLDLEIIDTTQIEQVLIHTYTSLLAKSSSRESRLVNFLKVLEFLRLAGILQIISPDTNFILRQCRQYSRSNASIYALLLAGDRVQAVREALVIDVLLAKQIATKADSSEEKRLLWLEIASFVVTHEDDMKKAISLIRDSKNSLTIEDLLPLLPDFTEIDFFKDEICKTLEDCSTSISNIKIEMQQLADDVDSTELESMKNRAYATAYSNHKCDLCCDELRSNQFYLFPCSHAFHSHCLSASALKTLTSSQLADLQIIQASLKSLQGRVGDIDSRARMQEHDSLQQQFDSLVASDCPLCGYAIIKQLNHSLVEDISQEEFLSWTL